MLKHQRRRPQQSTYYVKSSRMVTTTHPHHGHDSRLFQHDELNMRNSYTEIGHIMMTADGNKQLYANV
eukprot:6210654-Pleurochrysis_carterae.AAC.5